MVKFGLFVTWSALSSAQSQPVGAKSRKRTRLTQLTYNDCHFPESKSYCVEVALTAYEKLSVGEGGGGVEDCCMHGEHMNCPKTLTANFIVMKQQQHKNR